MRLIAWLLRAFIFFTLFAFALNNQQTATVNWFFGVNWRAPMVIVVLVAFAAGCVLATLAMLPGWWRQRQKLGGAAKRASADPAAAVSSNSAPGAVTTPGPQAPTTMGPDGT